MFTLVSADLAVVRRLSVRVDGRAVGDVVLRQWGTDGSQVWVATLQLGDHEAVPAGLSLVHGQADNAEQAVKNAIHAYRAHFRRALQLLEQLDADLRGVPL